MKRVLTIFTVAALALAMPATAKTICMPTEELAASLKDWYGEVPVASDMDTGRQLWASVRTGTWTLVEQRSDGMSCTLESGGGYGAGNRRRDTPAPLTG